MLGGGEQFDHAGIGARLLGLVAHFQDIDLVRHFRLESHFDPVGDGGAVFRDRVNRLETVADQLALTEEFFTRLADGEELAA